MPCYQDWDCVSSHLFFLMSSSPPPPFLFFSSGEWFCQRQVHHTRWYHPSACRDSRWCMCKHYVRDLLNLVSRWTQNQGKEQLEDYAKYTWFKVIKVGIWSVFNSYIGLLKYILQLLPAATILNRMFCVQPTCLFTCKMDKYFSSSVSTREIKLHESTVKHHTAVWMFNIMI